MEPKVNPLQICLHEVEGPVNLGSVARVMANTDHQTLRYTGSLTGREPEVRRFARSAYSLIEDAKHFNSLGELLSESGVVFGFTPRNPWQDGKQLAFEVFGARVREFVASGERVAILFGNEARGLENEDLVHCDFRVAIPTSSQFPSLNLSHAVLTALMQIRLEPDQVTQVQDDAPLAGVEMKGILANKVLEFMNIIEFLGPQPATSTRQQIDAIFRGKPWTQRECQLLLGLFNKASVRTRLFRDGSENTSKPSP